MQLRKETNLYDDEAVANALQDERDYAQSLNSKFSATYGTCTTVSSTAAKVVSLSGFVLFTGAKITVKFNNANSAANPTLNVNGTGAKPIWARNAVIAEQYYWTSQARIDFVYDGEHWMMTDAKSQEEIFAEFTNNGEIRGIFMKNNQMYVNMDYLQTGTLKLGGSSNGNGLMEVFNSSGTRVGRWDNTALYIGNISSALTSPNTKITTTGAITTNSLTASAYIYVDGNTTSYIKIPTTGTEVYTELGRSGLKACAYSNHVIVGGNNQIGNIEIRDTSENTSNTMEIYRDHISIDRTSSSRRSQLYYNKLYFYSVSGGTTSTLSYISDSGASINGSLSVSGSKNRLYETEDYGKRLLYSYETPSPFFGDIGDGVISSDGKCYIWIDSIFSETVSLNQYQVFLQKYGVGDCYVSECNPSYFIVEGTPNLAFAWELKAKQSDLDQRRLDTPIDTEDIEDDHDYGDDLMTHINTIRLERGVA